MLWTVALRWSATSKVGFFGEPLEVKREAMDFKFFLAMDVGLEGVITGAIMPSELCRESDGFFDFDISVFCLGGSGSDGRNERATRLNSEAQGAADFSRIAMTADTIFALSLSILELDSNPMP